MPDALAYQPALPYPPTRTPVGVLLTPLGGNILHVLARRGATPPVADLGDGSPFAVRALGPGQWLVVGEGPVAAQALDGAAVVDGGDGRVRIKVSGEGAVDLIASGAGLDLRLAKFPVGATATTLWRHIGIVLTRVEEDAFEVVVGRSFARSLWEEMGG